jgi:uncharacterized membrane protein YkvA (DUF1232 family)
MKWLENMPNKIRKNPMHYFLFVIILAAWLWYLFMPMDLLPDATPLVGFLDDAALIFLGLVGINKIFKARKSRR